jgi:signal transduction histidine kinase
MPYVVTDKVLFISEVGRILSSSLDYNLTLAVLARLVVSNIGDFCIVDILENGKMKRLVVRSSDPKKQAKVERFFTFPPDPKNKEAIYDAAKEGSPILIKRVTKKWLNTVSKIEEERQLVQELGLNSFIFAPLKSRGKVIGVLTVASSQKGFKYKDDDCHFVEALASRAGLAVDNARLFSEVQEALRSRDEFLSIASHELKTPLTSILMNMQFILMKIKKASGGNIDTKEFTKLIELNVEQSRRMSRLINDLLNISVISSGRLKIEKDEVNLKTLIQKVIAQFDTQLAKEKIKLTFKADGDAIGRMDRLRIEQVISNLISNAIKYGMKKPIEVSLENSENSAIITVRDYGIGIKDEATLRIFERFQRGVNDKDFKGIGVGLYITRQIVEAHGGKITVESIEGKGSTFIVTLPL